MCIFVFKRNCMIDKHTKTTTLKFSTECSEARLFNNIFYTNYNFNIITITL